MMTGKELEDYDTEIQNISPACIVNEDSVPSLIGYGLIDHCVPLSQKYYLLEVNRYLNMVGLLDDYNDYHQEQERQRNADITEQISYDVSDRAENFAEWEPER